MYICAEERTAAPHGSMKGFTLIEVLVTTAMIGVLMALAAPSFTEQIRRYRVDATREELLASIQLARMEALRQGQLVVMTRRTDCQPTPTANNDWSCGWQTFVDRDADNTIDSNEPITQTVDPPQGMSVIKNNVSPVTRIVFSRFGQISVLGQAFEIYAADSTVTKGYKICMSAGNRFRTIKGSETCS
jgi:type IV fimbrial biogenesis protein FimT